MAQPTSPTLSLLELITPNSSYTDGGNAWGIHINRVVRTSTGDIFATLSDNNTANDYITRLDCISSFKFMQNFLVYHRSPNGTWEISLSGDGGREPANFWPYASSAISSTGMCVRVCVRVCCVCDTTL